MSTAREMQNLILLWDDAITEMSATIANHSTEYTGFEAENLLDNNRQTCFKINDSGDDLYVEINLGASATIKGFGLLNHNAGTAGVSDFVIKYNSGGANTLATFDVSTYIGDDDFLFMPASSVSTQYVRYEFDSVDAAGLYLGRIFLAREAYDYTSGLLVGAPRGYAALTDITTGMAGTEHRNSRGPLRKRLSGLIPKLAGDPARAEIEAIIEHNLLNYKTFLHSWPYKSSTYTGNNRYGLAVHARWNLEEWLFLMEVAGLSQLPIETIEVL